MVFVQNITTSSLQAVEGVMPQLPRIPVDDSLELVALKFSAFVDLAQLLLACLANRPEVDVSNKLSALPRLLSEITKE